MKLIKATIVMFVAMCIAVPANAGGFGTFFDYVGYITYAGLVAGAFGHDDPLQLQERATRFFQEKLLHHYAADNPQAWVSMADALMTQEHLVFEGAKMKPLNLPTLSKEARNEQKHDAKNNDGRHTAGDAKQIINNGLKTEDDYILAATYLYLEAIDKADKRADKEAKDHKVEKRALSRMKRNSGETDLTAAVETNHNSIDPILLELGAPVSYRLEAARFLERYGKQSTAINFSALEAKLRADAQAKFDDPNLLSDPVRRKLLNDYGNELTDTPQKNSSVSAPAKQ